MIGVGEVASAVRITGGEGDPDAAALRSRGARLTGAPVVVPATDGVALIGPGHRRGGGAARARVQLCLALPPGGCASWDRCPTIERGQSSCRIDGQRQGCASRSSGPGETMPPGCGHRDRTRARRRPASAPMRGLRRGRARSSGARVDRAGEVFHVDLEGARATSRRSASPANSRVRAERSLGLSSRPDEPITLAELLATRPRGPRPAASPALIGREGSRTGDRRPGGRRSARGRRGCDRVGQERAAHHLDPRAVRHALHAGSQLPPRGLQGRHGLRCARGGAACHRRPHGSRRRRRAPGDREPARRGALARVGDRRRRRPRHPGSACRSAPTRGGRRRVRGPARRPPRTARGVLGCRRPGPCPRHPSGARHAAGGRRDPRQPPGELPAAHQPARHRRSPTAAPSSAPTRRPRFPGDASGRGLALLRRGGDDAPRRVRIALSDAADVEAIVSNGDGPPPRRPWLPALARHIPLAELLLGGAVARCAPAGARRRARAAAAAAGRRAASTTAVCWWWADPGAGKSTALAVVAAQAPAGIVRIPATAEGAWDAVTAARRASAGTWHGGADRRPRHDRLPDCRTTTRHEIMERLERVLRSAGESRILVVASTQRLTGATARLADLLPRRIVLPMPSRADHFAGGRRPGAFRARRAARTRSLRRLSRSRSRTVARAWRPRLRARAAEWWPTRPSHRLRRAPLARRPSRAGGVGASAASGSRRSTSTRRSPAMSAERSARPDGRARRLAAALAGARRGASRSRPRRRRVVRRGAAAADRIALARPLLRAGPRACVARVRRCRARPNRPSRRGWRVGPPAPRSLDRP